MINKMCGYTIIELIATVALLVIIMLGGTAIFYRSFRSSGVSDIQAILNSSMNSLDAMIEKSLRYGTVVRVVDGAVDYDRDSCLLSGDNGVVGDTLVVRSNDGSSVIYSHLEDGTVSSNSGEIISNPAINVTNLQFTWYCRSGVNDKINLLIEATTSAVIGEGSSGKFVKDINLLNSGINL